MVSEGMGWNGRQKRKLMTWRPEPGMTKRQVKEEHTLQQLCLSAESDPTNSGWACDVRGVCRALETRLRGTEPAPKTLGRYDELLKRILPAIGHIRLYKLQPHPLMAFYAGLQNTENPKRGFLQSDAPPTVPI